MLRVNSPGGSYVASDTIWREVVRARGAGKPVVVSMGDVAASGGYFISMAADAIVAQPGTLTGSIGVLSGKPVVGELLGRYGVSTDTVTAGEHAAMFGTTHPYSEDEWALVNRWLGRAEQRLQEVREDGKGRHTTTHRELFVLDGVKAVLQADPLGFLVPLRGGGVERTAA